MTSKALASFVATLKFDALPTNIRRRTVNLFLHWIASTIFGRRTQLVTTLEKFAARHGPSTGACELFTNRKKTSPLFAAYINAAASRVIEYHTNKIQGVEVIFPAALAAAQETGASGKDLITAFVAGYEVFIRITELLNLHDNFMSDNASTIGAAAATSKILGLNETEILNALGSARAQSAGNILSLNDTDDSNQLHCSKSAGNGLMSAYLARDGLTSPLIFKDDMVDDDTSTNFSTTSLDVSRWSIMKPAHGIPSLFMAEQHLINRPGLSERNDPLENILSREKLEQSIYKLIEGSRNANHSEATKIIEMVWDLENRQNVRDWFIS